MAQLLEDVLVSVSSSTARTILTAIAAASAEIAELARVGGASKTGSENTFGDKQLELDLAAECAVVKSLKDVPEVAVIASEETPKERVLHADGTHSVAVDPLDGSSIVGCNWAVGSIFGIWEGTRLHGASGRNVVAAAATVYGPRTTLWMAAAGLSGTVEVTLGTDGRWSVSNQCDTMSDEVHVFSPANLRAAQDDDAYGRLVNYYMKERYTLRYSGGLVPDVTQIFKRRGGIFVSPVSKKAPAKLRVLYETMPMAYLVEAAGGMAVDHTGKRMLDRIVDGCDERVGFCVGGKLEVARYVDMCCTRTDTVR